MVCAHPACTQQLEEGRQEGRQFSPGPTNSASAAPASGGARKSPCPACLVVTLANPSPLPLRYGTDSSYKTRASLTQLLAALRRAQFSIMYTWVDL